MHRAQLDGTVMMARLGAVCAALLLASGTAAPASGQSPDAFVLPPGMVRVAVEGVHASYDSRFGTGGKQPLAAALSQPLTAANLAPLRPLSEGLRDFFAATDPAGSPPPAVDPETLTLGTPDVRLTEGAVRVPMRAAIGLLPRVEVGVSVPLERSERFVSRFSLAGSTVGINPQRESNAALLGRIGAEWAALGRSRLLPTDSSALGRELQRRVRALTGSALRLPSAADADALVLQQLLVEDFGVGRLDTRVEPFQPGDVQLFARALLLSSFGQAPFPTDTAGTAFRSALVLSARLPTGTEPDTLQLIPLERQVGIRGFGVGLVNDLFVDDRFWATVSLSYSLLRPAELTRRIISPAEPLAAVAPPALVQVDPGDELEVRLAPRYRLAEAIALGVEYQLLRKDASTFAVAGGGEDASVLDLEGGSVHRLGLSARYTTLPAFWAGRTRIPAEVSLTYASTLGGPAGVPAANLVTVTASLLPRLWGRGGR